MAVNDNGAIVDFAAANSITDLFKIKEKVTSETAPMTQKMLK